MACRCSPLTPDINKTHSARLRRHIPCSRVPVRIIYYNIIIVVHAGPLLLMIASAGAATTESTRAQSAHCLRRSTARNGPTDHFRQSHLCVYVWVSVCVSVWCVSVRVSKPTENRTLHALWRISEGRFLFRWWTIVFDPAFFGTRLRTMYGLQSCRVTSILENWLTTCKWSLSVSFIIWYWY